MTTLFKKKELSERRTIRYPLLLNEAEAAKIRHSAKMRNLSVAEYMRRAALGKRTDVDYVTEIVLQLSDVVRAIRAIHKSMVEMEIEPPEEIWGPIMDHAEAAMIRITK
jgi:hypothetical protein